MLTGLLTEMPRFRSCSVLVSGVDRTCLTDWPALKLCCLVFCQRRAIEFAAGPILVNLTFVDCL